MNMRFIFEKLRATRPLLTSRNAGKFGLCCGALGFGNYFYVNQNRITLPGDENRPFNFKESLRLALQNGGDNTPGRLKTIYLLCGLSASFALFSKKPYQLISACAIYYTWNKFLLEKLRDFVLAPTNPVEVKYLKNFSQANLINNIITKLDCPDVAVVKKGVCSGVLDEWTDHEEKGEDLIPKINCADIQDINLLKSIYQSQTHKEKRLGKLTDILEYPIEPGISRAERTYELTSIFCAIAADVIQKPDTTLFVSILQPGNREKIAHKTGLRVKKENDVLKIKFFDLNYLEATFNHENDAIRSMVNQFRFFYRDFFESETKNASIVTHRERRLK